MKYFTHEWWVSLGDTEYMSVFKRYDSYLEAITDKLP